MYSATHESITVARKQRQENTYRVKNQWDCRIRYRALWEKNNTAYLALKMEKYFMLGFQGKKKPFD